MESIRSLFLLGVLLVGFTAAVWSADGSSSGASAEPGRNQEGDQGQGEVVMAGLENSDDSAQQLFDRLCEAVEGLERGEVAGSGRSKRSVSYDNVPTLVQYGRSVPDLYGDGYQRNVILGNRAYRGLSFGSPYHYDSYQQHQESPSPYQQTQSKSYLSYGKADSVSPIVTFEKSFTPGKTYVEQGNVVRNYYRHGTYDVALQHYKFIPVIKVVPFTTHKTVGYTGHIQTHNSYTAHICKDCYHGMPKIDIVADRPPYSYVTRRFVYLPENHHANRYDVKSPGYDYGHH